LVSPKLVAYIAGNSGPGAFHSLNYRKYAGHYLAAFAYRFNRRFDLRDLVARLIVDDVRSKPVKEMVVRAHAEAGL